MLLLQQRHFNHGHFKFKRHQLEQENFNLIVLTTIHIIAIL
jgi:hypothetical protein